MSETSRTLLRLTVFGLVMALVAATFGARAQAAPGDLLKTVNIPAAALCSLGEGFTSGTAVAIIPGGKLNLPKIPILLVTSCRDASGTTKLFFLDPSTDPATLVKTLNTTVSPSFGWESLALRADRADLAGCGTVAGQVAVYSIDFVITPPLNSVTDGTATFLRNAPAGATCDGIGWDLGDKTIYESSTVSVSPPDSTPVSVLHLLETGTGSATPLSHPPVPAAIRSRTVPRADAGRGSWRAVARSGRTIPGAGRG